MITNHLNVDELYQRAVFFKCCEVFQLWCRAGNVYNEIDTVLGSVREDISKYIKAWDSAFEKLLMVETPLVRQAICDMGSNAANRYIVALLIENYLVNIHTS